MTPLDERNWQPATLEERGVAVPFTSPVLAGARIRPSRRGMDVVVPHPGGVRGVYIFALAALPEFCTPTMHDVLLAKRLASLRPLVPATVRAVACDVAAGGAAGRAAGLAAASAVVRQEERRRRFELCLLQGVLRQEGGGCDLPAEGRIAAAVHRVADRTGKDAEAIRADVGLLSGVLAGSGLDSPDERGRCSALLVSLASMREAVVSWSGGMGSAALRLADAAGALAETGQSVRAAAQALLADPVALLTAWAAKPDILAGRLWRPDWFLDGWEHLSLLWHVAETDDDRAGAIAEALALLPPIPPEVDGWLARPERLAPLRERHVVPPSPGRAPSELVSLVGRNERMRALAA